MSRLLTATEVLDDVKNYLDITWLDDEGDKRLLGIIQRGMAYLEGKIGACDFLNETQERALLFDYVMYTRSGEFSQFQENYKSEIIALQIEKRVEKNENGQSDV